VVDSSNFTCGQTTNTQIFQNFWSQVMLIISLRVTSSMKISFC